MTKQLTPLRRKDREAGYQAAVRDIVAWLRMNAMSGHTLAAQIEAKFGGRTE